MRNWVIFGVIICLLGALIVYETNINRSFFSKSTKLIDEVMEKFSTGDYAEDEIDELAKVWNKSKPLFYVFYSHTVLNNFEECLSKISVASEIGDKEMMGYFADELKNINDMFKNYHKLKLGNVF